jgi:glucokinase-like ROK family protein
MTRPIRAGDQVWVREHNLALVLSYLWDIARPALTSEIAGASGLNRGTVGSLLAQLGSWGFVREAGLRGERPGRPGMLAEINPDGGRIVGLEVGVGFASVIVTDLAARPRWQNKLDVASPPTADERSGQRVLRAAERLLDKAVNEIASEGQRVLGIGVGLPGLVDHRSGELLYAPNLGLRNVPVGRHLASRYPEVPIRIENEANAAAQGERAMGVAKGVDNFVYLSAGVGLGAGLVLDGKVFGGAGGLAGEVGHMTLEPEGPMCNCGNRGCWEVLVGPRSILASARTSMQVGSSPYLLSLCRGRSEQITMELVVEAARQGDEGILQGLAETARYLGIGIANIVNFCNPEMVILGGVLSLVSPYILEGAEAEARRRALGDPSKHVVIRESAFGFDACAIGASTLIVNEILARPSAWKPNSPGGT